jgi:DNA repair protein RadD
MSAPDLRPYQMEFIGAFDQAVAFGAKRILGVAPTGSGKTVIAAAIIRTAAACYQQRVLVFSHRREITRQTSQKLHDLGVDHGIIQAGFPARPSEPVQIGSIQTLWSRAIRGSSLDLPIADLVFIDEAHHCPAETYQRVIAKYPDAVILGLSATPCRRDGRGLGNTFEKMIECPQVDELVRLGFLVPTLVYAPADGPDLSGIRTQAGDYIESQLAERMNTARLVGNVVTEWGRHAERRKTIVFAVDVAHSRHLCNEFEKSGAKVAHIDGGTPTDERDEALRRLKAGEIEIICNCQVLTEGFDAPDVGCIVLARPTKSPGLYRQMGGRGLRPTEGKQNCIILDHAGATLQHGFLEDRMQWTLDTTIRAANKAQASRGDGSTKSRLCDCPKCGALRTAGERCRSCGYLPQRPARDYDFEDGDLARIDRNRAAQPHVYSAEDKRRWHAMFVYIGQERGYSHKWPRANYMQKFGHWPQGWDAPVPISPDAEVRSWVRSRMIAYAKSRSAA